jgi:hypothetical protein
MAAIGEVDPIRILVEERKDLGDEGVAPEPASNRATTGPT